MLKVKENLHWLLSIGVILFFLILSFLFGMKWFIGLGVVAVFLGSIITPIVREGLRRYAESYNVQRTHFKISDFQRKRHLFLTSLVGVLERSFFTVLIGYEVPAVGAALILWITVKMLTGWNRYTRDTFEDRVRALNALLSNLISLMFAVLGGLIIHDDIPLWFLS